MLGPARVEIKTMDMIRNAGCGTRCDLCNG